jgi:transposase InsO family protein
MVAMSEYSFSVEHLPGIQNIIPDTLSRRHAEDTQSLELRAITRQQVQQSVSEGREEESRERAENRLDEDNEELMETKKQVTFADPLEMQGRQDRGELQEVPADVGVEVDDPRSRDWKDGGTVEERKRIIEQEHAAGHSGREGMFQSLVNKGFYWPTMREECRACARACRQCLRYNVEKDGFHPLTSIRAKLPMDHVAIDHYTMNVMSEGYAAVLLLVDICTGFVFLRPVKDYTAGEAIRACIDVFTLFGFPKIIQSDNGTAFVAEMTREFFNKVGVEQRTVSPYNPRANGAAEIRVKSAKNMMLKVVHGAVADWAISLPIVNYWMNQRVQVKTGSSPFAYMFARQVNGFKNFTDDVEGERMTEEQLMARYRTIKEVIFPSLAARKGQEQDKVEARFNNKKKIVDAEYFPPGALVMVKDPHRRSKNEALYTGPYSVLRRTKGKSYVLMDHGKDELFPRDVPPDQMKLVSNTEMLDAEQRYEVEAVVNHRGRKGAYEYLVHWKGFNRSEDTWETPAQFDSMAMIEQYWKRRKGSTREKVVSPILEGICIGSGKSDNVDEEGLEDGKSLKPGRIKKKKEFIEKHKLRGGR